MTEDVHGMYTLAALQKQYCLNRGEARRLIESFGNRQQEMDRLLAARGRTQRHRVREIRTPVSKAPFGIG
ncbi:MULTISPECIES: hypothetical protein [unclassified Rhizobium]|uniref:hypothetical protein n=1 Tax=unclassified Rhizobium TaxID=2613769 RepID=UPI00161E0782|nr:MULTISPECIES: hypothetical protein [unclassified Rhizobium]MBB3317998.1 hypothetical protein [Rhizobium sp. BK181]MBB3544273.1 hypothetical protein [Rhizobium sp. BK399]MCS3742886.1 hypothetical protein [Rhizobium sp. BK661]MCS4095100.1 hypothetical protein [Rhizobium sp. BK176]